MYSHGNKICYYFCPFSESLTCFLEHAELHFEGPFPPRTGEKPQDTLGKP